MGYHLGKEFKEPPFFQRKETAVMEPEKEARHRSVIQTEQTDEQLSFQVASQSCRM
jgi:hypothetical protein